MPLAHLGVEHIEMPVTPERVWAAIRTAGSEEHRMMDVFEGIRTLLAVRRYQDRPVPEAVVRKIVEAGRLTGSAMNLSPGTSSWSRIEKRSESWARWRAPARIPAEAPLAIVVAVEKTGYAVSDASRAIHSMLLTAWSEGVGSNWVGFGGLEKVNALLGIPAKLDVLAILPFGYPVDKIGRGKKNRKPLAAVAHRERFGQPFE
jgi:nitroreductase